MQQIVEIFPRAHTARALQPDIGGIGAAGEPHAHFGKGIHHHLGVLLVIGNGIQDLLVAFGSEHGFGGPLGDIAGAVELAALAALPQL